MVRKRASYEFDFAKWRGVGCTTEDRADVRREGSHFNH